MRSLSITTLILLLVWILSCANKDAGGSSSCTDKGAVENISSTQGIPPDYFLPLPSTYLSEIDIPHIPSLSFVVGITDKVPPPPQPQMGWGIEYDNESQRLYCWGTRRDTHPHQLYSGFLDAGYKDDFVELIQYIQSHPEFFSYGEYQGAPPGEINTPEQYDMSVWVSVAGYDYVPGEHANTYAIAKCVSGSPSEAVQHVMDVMRTVFLPEVLNHPYVVPEVRYDPPLNPE